MTSYRREDYAKYRLQKATETISEVELLIENKLWNTAINRMYYACFYAVGALLVINNIETSSHSGTRLKFGQLFIKTGIFNRDLSKTYSDLFEKRQKGDYNDFFDHDEETVLLLFPKAKSFVESLESYISKS